MRTVTTGDAKMIEEGKTLFATCAGCHGQNGGGVLGTGPSLNSKTFLAAASDDYLVRTIEKGRAGTTMVPWGGQLSRDQIYAVIAYIRSWQDVEAATLDEKDVKGNETSGEKLFRDVCSGCHGRSGAGYQETSNGTGIGRAGFLSQVSNGYLRYIIKNGKSQTKMRPFKEGSKVAVANLTDEQIEDVIFYLRRTGW
jgi:mono/diheme cytochrome c family protein